MLGLSLLPSIAYRVNDKLSLGASLNAMYGMYENQVAINNVDPAFGDGRLKIDDNTWGWGVNLGLLYEIDERTRVGLTWNSEVELDFSAAAEFSNLAPGLHNLLSSRGLLNANLDIKIKVPQQLMGSLFMQLDERWALLGNLGWQEWSRFGQIQLGIDNTNNPSSLTTDLEFDDTWHVALGAQYRMSQPWLLNFGIAYDSEFQDGSNVSPLLPVNSAWRFGIGAQQALSKTAYWGFAAEYMYGGTLDTELNSTLPVALGGRGDLVGSYDNVGTLFVAAYYNWTF
jgi:long-chain fatty acid transport protein